MGDAWEPGEWNLGKHYKWIGWIAVIWVAFISVLFILPTSPGGVPWRSEFSWLYFNYAIVAVGGTMLLVGGWWLLSAKKWFTGPIVQGTPEELAAREARLDAGRSGSAPSAA